MHVLMGLVVQDRQQDGGPDVPEGEEGCEKRAEDYDAFELIGVREEVGVGADVEAVLVPVGLVVAAPCLGLVVALRPGHHVCRPTQSPQSPLPAE